MAAAAILDVDGTLVDTNYQHALCWYRAFREHDLVLPVWRLHRPVGMGGDKFVEAVAGPEVEKRAETISARGRRSWPDVVRAALDKAATSDAWMVGDTPRDVEAARRVGLETIGVRTGGFSEAELGEAGGIAIYESVRELDLDLANTPLS